MKTFAFMLVMIFTTNLISQDCHTILEDIILLEGQFKKETKMICLQKLQCFEIPDQSAINFNKNLKQKIINRKNDLDVCWQNFYSHWTKLPDQADDISVGGICDIYVLRRLKKPDHLVIEAPTSHIRPYNEKIPNPFPYGFDGIFKWEKTKWKKFINNHDGLSIAGTHDGILVSDINNEIYFSGDDVSSKKGWVFVGNGREVGGSPSTFGNHAWYVTNTMTTNGFEISAVNNKPIIGGQGAIKVAVTDYNDNAWIINDQEVIYQLINGHWVHIASPPAKDIAMGGNEEIWIIGGNPEPGGFGIFRWNRKGHWTKITGGAVSIAVDEFGTPWVVNDVGEIFTFAPDISIESAIVQNVQLVTPSTISFSLEMNLKNYGNNSGEINFDPNSITPIANLSFNQAQTNTSQVNVDLVVCSEKQKKEILASGYIEVYIYAGGVACDINFDNNYALIKIPLPPNAQIMVVECYN